jgi:hypothetical protein
VRFSWYLGKFVQVGFNCDFWARCAEFLSSLFVCSPSKKTRHAPWTSEKSQSRLLSRTAVETKLVQVVMSLMLALWPGNQRQKSTTTSTWSDLVSAGSLADTIALRSSLELCDGHQTSMNLFKNDVGTGYNLDGIGSDAWIGCQDVYDTG